MIPSKGKTTDSLRDSFHWKTIYIIKKVFPIIILNPSQYGLNPKNLGNSNSRRTVIILSLKLTIRRRKIENISVSYKVLFLPGTILIFLLKWRLQMRKKISEPQIYFGYFLSVSTSSMREGFCFVLSTTIFAGPTNSAWHIIYIQ